MKQIVRIKSLDGLSIGPFDDHDKAQAWVRRSIFASEDYEIGGLIEPRPDHRVNRFQGISTLRDR